MASHHVSTSPTPRPELAVDENRATAISRRANIVSSRTHGFNPRNRNGNAAHAVDRARGHDRFRPHHRNRRRDHRRPPRPHRDSVGGGSGGSTKDQNTQTGPAPSTKASSDEATPAAAIAADIDCIICLELIRGPCELLPCHHSHFHLACIERWLCEHPTCPLCKQGVEKIRFVHPEQGESVIDGVPLVSRRPLSQRQLTGLERGRVAYPPPPVRYEYLRAVERRRYVYRHGLYSMHVGTNPLSGYRRVPSPTDFAYTPSLQSRARVWLRRELQVFSSFTTLEPPDSQATTTTTTTDGVEPPLLIRDNPSASADSNPLDVSYSRYRRRVEFTEFIIMTLGMYHLQDGEGKLEESIRPELGGYARQFLHELRNWIRSPATTLDEYDRLVQYPLPLP
ncbi:hypothetical protein VTJ04DRAFT_7080 [Mycothermus thermophilus]|uniref:uncharacterized protein n=1 Tax=Humicola insolens TaxID=85995 RepID=UPI00374317F8